MSMRLHFPALATCLLIAANAAAQPATDPAAAADAAAPVVPLAPVEARGKRSLLEDQAARRKKLLDESAPCLGCDAKPLQRKPKLLERIANFTLDQVTPQAPKETNEADRTDRALDQQRALPGNANP